MDLTTANSAEGSPELPPSAGATTTNTTSTSSSLSEQKKRNRIRFSCTSCRDKKLKCNRQSPCDQCEKRHLSDSCRFVPYVNPRPGANGTAREALAPGSPSSAGPGPGPRGKVPAGEPAMHSRLKHLEHLVQVLKSQKRDAAESSTVAAASPKPEDDERLPAHCDNKLAGVLTEDKRYVEAANWESILDDIVSLTNDLKTHEQSDDLDYTEQPPPAQKNISLLAGGFPYATVSELAALLPPRPVLDRLISRLFQIPEPGWVVYHVPSFLREYDAFWRDKSQATYSWIGLLFCMASYAALDCERSKDWDEVPGNLGPPRQVFETFKRYAAHCLCLGDYSAPGKWKVEALVLYFGCEYFQKNDSPLGCSIILSIMVRLAMHMGMHRDPKHYPDMTPFEGEMRRRAWMLLTEIDRLVSYQFGLPSNVHPGIADTELPRNLHDTDFDVDSKELPPSRPETERTICLHTIVKARLLRVFGDITSALNARDGLTYATFASLDKRLEEAHQTTPSILQHRSFSQSLADPVDLIMQRYWLDFTYQKSRLILHRQFLARGRMDKRFEYSRRTCLDAATQILKHQYDIHCETQPGGRLAKDRGLITSLSIHDFLLADMILCLELSFVNARKRNPQSRPEVMKHFAQDTSKDIMSQEQIMEILQTSRSIWQSMRKDSAEANKGFKILTRMLNESTGTAFESSPESTGAAPQLNMEESMAAYPPFFHFGADTGSNMSTAPLDLSGSSQTQTPNWGSMDFADNTGLGQAPQTWLSDLDGQAQDLMDGIVEASVTGDWSMWDLQVQKGPTDVCQIPWHNFFQTHEL
ncbi:hypothetical protein QBC37DRAFT_59085 [Rhypophila decipiens]|uniref:Zn(2)-C6 fungal-type domain-containing protein n=1 Tax=Rhypophila decipiens TaxID=261697 RepID=A0AAN6XY64_9PEZI|nr:hypothetical protein QBC37DRAFT_59085 [Rhypophila decipiens]